VLVAQVWTKSISAAQVDAMGKRGNAKSLPVLLKLLAASSGQIRNHATISLEKLGMMAAERVGVGHRSLRGRAASTAALSIPDPGQLPHWGHVFRAKARTTRRNFSHQVVGWRPLLPVRQDLQLGEKEAAN